MKGRALLLLAFLITSPVLVISGPETVQEAVVLPTAPGACEWERQVVARELGPKRERVPGYATFGDVCAVSSASRNKVEAAARDFIWSHWGARERGLVILSRPTKEGDSTISFYYIEPDAKGEWQVRVAIERLLSDRRFSQAPSGGALFFRNRTSYAAHAVHRIEVRHTGLAARVPINDNAARDPVSYRLSFHIDGVQEPVDF